MLFGVNTWVWTSPLTTEAFDWLAPHIAEQGFDLIEIPLESIGELDIDHAAERVRTLGLAVSVCAVIGPDRDLIHPDPTVRRHGMAYVRRCIEAAHVLGATNVIGPFYSGVGRLWRSTREERERDLDVLTGELRTLAGYAVEHGTVLCIEPLNRFETSFLNTAEQAIELVDRVDHPACGLMLDTFHVNIEERSAGDAIRAAGQRLRHVHASENDRGAPGSGHLPWQEIAEACHAIGFDGPVVIESFASEVQAIARAAAIWRPVAPSPDALAERGLAFLRSAMTW